jgi:anti-anti-sigma factor
MVMSTARPVYVEAPARLAVHLFADAEVARLEVSGEVDLSSTSVLEGALADALACGAPSVVIDLDGCDFFAACGYRALAEAADVTVARGGALVVERAPASLRIIAGIVAEPGVVVRDPDDRRNP